MKKSIQYYAILAIFLLVTALTVALWVAGVNQQSTKYNHGIHSGDGGRWVLTCVDNKGTYVYTCDHCHEQLIAWRRF